MERFHGRNVVVTGAGSGIGAAVVARFVQEGATVLGMDVSEARHPSAEHVIADVRDRASIAQALDTFVDKRGEIDVLVTCAGVYRPADALAATDADFDLLFGVNVQGTFIAAQESARRMPRGGCIVTVASVASRLSTPENVLYSASKGAVESLTRGLAVSLAPHGIRVNGVRPGPVSTPQGQAAMQNPSYRERMLGRQLIPELAEPTDLASVVAFLASDDARFIDGELLNVDAGIQAVR